MKFYQLTQFIQKIEQTASRIEMTRLLADLFKQLTSEEIEKTVYLLQGRVCPLYEKVEFGIAEKMVIRAAVKALQIDNTQFLREYQKRGDLGGAVEFFKYNIHSLEEKDMSILEVFTRLFQLAQAMGVGSQETKINILATLIRELDPLSVRYIVRIPLATLRLGFSDMTVLDAYSWMLCGDKSLRSIIQNAYQVRPDLGFIGRLLKEKGKEGIKKVKPQVFTPVIMMRAERLSSGQEIIEKIGECGVEPKYDGFRLQIHYQKKTAKVRLFTRGLEDVSSMYPDIIDGIRKEVIVSEVIFEGEAVGYNPVTGNFLPFQETVQRKRKYQIAEKAQKIPLRLFAFDILYLNGENLLSVPFVIRRNKLNSIIALIHSKSQTIAIAPDKRMKDAKEVELYFSEVITQGLEGIIAKKLDGVYQPGARGWNWIKYKRSYSSKIDDTIDCLVLGYDLGKGKRAGFGIGAFLVGVYDEKKDCFVTVAKIGTGLTDEEWRNLRERAKKFVVKEKPKNYLVDKLMTCDVWLKPAVVVEIRADEITRSPVHTAGRIMVKTASGGALEVKEPGYALRFPRLERFRDKLPTDVASVSEIIKMFNRQLGKY